MARKNRRNTSWDPLAKWYDGWMGKEGSEHHQKLAIPALMRLLDPRSDERILDVGAGQGVLAPYVSKEGAHYTGVDASPALIKLAKRHHGKQGDFYEGDARELMTVVRGNYFDAATFLLSIQDMDPLDTVLDSVVFTLKPKSRIAILMTHPAFRIPRQSGWGFDENRKLRYRRIDSYLTHLDVPLKQYKKKSGERGVTRSYHRPIQTYINALGERGYLIERIEEVPVGEKDVAGQNIAKSDKRAAQEFPLYLGLRAIRR